jgi:hypothetical protein
MPLKIVQCSLIIFFNISVAEKSVTDCPEHAETESSCGSVQEQTKLDMLWKWFGSRDTRIHKEARLFGESGKRRAYNRNMNDAMEKLATADESLLTDQGF